MSMSNVVYLDGRNGVVARLESLVADARAGKVDAVAIATQHGGDSVGTVFALAQRGNVWMLLGALEELRYRILHEGCEQVSDNTDDGTSA